VPTGHELFCAGQVVETFVAMVDGVENAAKVPGAQVVQTRSAIVVAGAL
jgi:hypothetical protein